MSGPEAQKRLKGGHRVALPSQKRRSLRCGERAEGDRQSSLGSQLVGGAQRDEWVGLLHVARYAHRG
jgi:hypothetical protein